MFLIQHAPLSTSTVTDFEKHLMMINVTWQHTHIKCLPCCLSNMHKIFWTIIQLLTSLFSWKMG